MIVVLVIILFALMLFVGGERGVDSFFSLVKTMVALIINVYLIAWGFPVVLTTLLVCAFFVVCVLYMQNGNNIKMHAAAISVLLVILLVVTFVCPILHLAGISGYNEIEQYEEISMYLSSNLSISMASVCLAAVVIGLLGAIMDTAVAITTAINEVYENNKELSAGELFASGLHVGKDILGTTVNTLFFAGLGESIMLAVLFMKNEDTFAIIINSKSLLQEVTAILVGAIGCLMIIPLSSMMIAVMLKMSGLDEKISIKEKVILIIKEVASFIGSHHPS